MSKINWTLCVIVFLAAVITVTSNSYAQSGTLNAKNIELNNGSNTITLQLPASVTNSWTLTWPNQAASVGGRQWMFDDGTGTLHWGVPASASSAHTLLYNT